LIFGKTSQDFLLPHLFLMFQFLNILHQTFLMKKNDRQFPFLGKNFFGLLMVLLIGSALTFNYSCKTAQKVVIPVSTDDGIITFNFLQLNDVYEIAPLEGGKAGGMARVATLRKRLTNENPNTLTVLAGDFLSPSLIGTIKKDGKRIKGAQMVEVMNATGVDLVTFGNHEFDIKEQELQDRINESEFTWLGTSVRRINTKTGKVSKFYQETDSTVNYVPDTWIWEISDEDGTSIRVGFFGATLDMNQVKYVKYLDVTNTCLEAVQTLSLQTDVVIGLTHLDVAEDLKLAAKLPQVPLLMGGHDHHHIRESVGNTLVTKADANAKTAYVHTLTYNKNTRETKVSSKLIEINDKMHSDEEVKTIVDKWKRIMDDNITKVVDRPYAEIYYSKVPLDAREAVNRREQTNVGRMINEAMMKVAKREVDLSFFNSGSIRIDDKLEGVITAVDVFKILPFGGQLVEIDIKGDLLIKVLNESKSRVGQGAYLQRKKVFYSDKKEAWMVNGTSIDPAKEYHAITTDFLLQGIDLKTLHINDPGITKSYRPDPDDRTDLRNNVILTFIDYLVNLPSERD